MADLVFLKWGRQPIISSKSLLSPPIHEKTVLTGCASSTSANPLMVYIPRQRNPGSGTATKVQRSHSRSRKGWQNYFWNFFFENGCASASQPLLNWPIVITARKRSCGKVIFIHMSVSHSVHRGVLCMMSLPVWLPGPMFLLWSHAPSRVLCAGGPLDREYPGQKTPGQRAPWIETPLYSKERAIRILLEYILVGYFSLLIFLQFH